MRQDYEVRFRAEESIASAAIALRHYIGIKDNQLDLDVIAVIVKLMKAKGMKNGCLQLKFFDRNSPAEGPPAFVEYTSEKVMLHVDRAIWKRANERDPDACYVICHEIGHIVLHDTYAKPFSNDSSTKINFAQNENSAEWQANTFAKHFLLPESVVEILQSEDAIIECCNVLPSLARDRAAELRDKRRRAKLRYSGDPCPGCLNFTLVRNGTCLKCETCGGTTGCS